MSDTVSLTIHETPQNLVHIQTLSRLSKVQADEWIEQVLTAFKQSPWTLSRLPQESGAYTHSLTVEIPSALLNAIQYRARQRKIPLQCALRQIIRVNLEYQGIDLQIHV